MLHVCTQRSGLLCWCPGWLMNELLRSSAREELIFLRLKVFEDTSPLL